MKKIYEIMRKEIDKKLEENQMILFDKKIELIISDLFDEIFLNISEKKDEIQYRIYYHNEFIIIDMIDSESDSFDEIFKMNNLILEEDEESFYKILEMIIDKLIFQFIIIEEMKKEKKYNQLIIESREMIKSIRYQEYFEELNDGDLLKKIQKIFSEYGLNLIRYRYSMKIGEEFLIFDFEDFSENQKEELEENEDIRDIYSNRLSHILSRISYDSLYEDEMNNDYYEKNFEYIDEYELDIRIIDDIIESNKYSFEYIDE